MFRLTLFPLLLLCLAQSAPAQCTKKMSDLPAAPELLGFRLGMTKAEVKPEFRKLTLEKPIRLE